MILGTTRAVRVFAYPRPVDLRNGYNGLYGMVKTGLGRDPLSGELYLFVNKRRDACKVLVFDGTGLCIFRSVCRAGGSRPSGARTRPPRGLPRASSPCSSRAAS